MIITICGSMRFFEEMLVVATEETLKGNIVLMPFAMKLTLSLDEQDALDELHLKKIDMADKILVVTDYTGYTGYSTQQEMAYAMHHGKFDGIDDIREIPTNASS